MENILKSGDFSGEQAHVSQLGNNPVLFAPYLMGERTPHNDTAVRGAFVGLSLDTSRGQMTQAVLEGVAFAFRDALEIARSVGAEVRRATVCGGGAKSPVWRHILTNVLNIPMDYIQTEGPAMGAAMLAAKGCGTCGSLEELAARTVQVTDTAFPDAEIVRRYEERYPVFRALYPALRTLT